jgi:hypothetical protein
MLLASCHVTRLGDFGAGGDIGGGQFRGDLRYCIGKANEDPGGDIITFSVTGTIPLNSALPDLNNVVVIQGPGASSLTIQRSNVAAFRIFTIAPNTDVNISGVTVANGLVSDSPTATGGGIHNAGNLTLERVVVTGNKAQNVCCDAHGGGIYNAATGQLTVRDSTITGNLAYSEGMAGGGIYNLGSLTVTSSTVADNTAQSTPAFPFGHGGGLFNGPGGTATVINSTVHGNRSDFCGGFSAGGSLAVISHSTFSANSAGEGGGICVGGGNDFMRNTIVAGNTDGGHGPDVYGMLGISGYNLIGDTTGGSGFTVTDIRNVDAKLGPLANNGGPTQTMSLLPGSPAIDAGQNSDAPTWDQRGPGFPRIVNGRIDIGSFEVQNPPAPVPGPQSRAGSAEGGVAIAGGPAHSLLATTTAQPAQHVFSRETETGLRSAPRRNFVFHSPNGFHDPLEISYRVLQDDLIGFA